MLKILLICCLLLSTPSANSEEQPNYVPLPAETVQRYQQKLLPWKDDGTGRLIDHFDVAVDGRIALSFQPETGKQRAYVGIYDQSGTFLWGFSYSTRSAATVELVDDGLVLHLIERFAVIDENSRCIAMFEYADKSKSQAEIRRLETPRRRIGPNTYELRMASPLALGYSSLVRIASDGTETLIYHHPAQGIGSSLIFIGVIALVLIGIIGSLKKQDSKPIIRKHL